MALDVLALFRALGCAARAGYMVAAGESVKPSAFAELDAQEGINPAWYATLTQAYDGGLRADGSAMGPWRQAAQNILLGLVAADDPYYGTSVETALGYLHAQMLAQGETVKRATVTATVAADAANVGTGVVYVTTTRQDGAPLENLVAEESTLLITADSYTGGATAGREPWRWTGARNASSLGTGAPVGTFDFDSPTGSGGGAGGACVSSADDANLAGNLLTNSDFEDWTGSAPAVLDNWCLTVGTWGTSVERDGTNQLAGSYCVKFNTGATLNALTHQFDSDESDGTQTDAGTTADPTAFFSLAFNVWLKAAGVVSAGVLTVELVDGTGTVINDQAGTANSTTINLTALTTSYVAYRVGFRLPNVKPAIIRLRVRVSTALAGAAVYMDAAALAQLNGGLVNAYPGGPNIAVFSNPAVPFEASPDPDGFTIVTTNDRGGADFGATWQTMLFRLLGQVYFLAPSAASPTVPDTLITGGVPQPVAYYPLNGQPSGMLTDYSGNGRHLVESSPVYAAGKFWAALGGGSGTYTGSVSFTDLTVAGWCKFTSTSAGVVSSFITNEAGPTGILGLVWSRSGRTMIVETGGSTLYTSGVLAQDVWHFLAATYNASLNEVRVYVNGEMVFLTNGVMFSNPIETIVATGVSRVPICDLSVFDVVLTPVEIQALYAGGPNGDGRPVLPYPR